MKRYRLTRKAVSDMRSIGQYSTQNWGIPQRNKYLRQLNARFAWLAENPRLGKSRSDLDQSYLCFPEGEHLIFYRIVEDTVEIIGLPHRRMDVASHFDEE